MAMIISMLMFSIQIIVFVTFTATVGMFIVKYFIWLAKKLFPTAFYGNYED